MLCEKEDCKYREGAFCNEIEFCRRTLAEHDAKVRAEAYIECMRIVSECVWKDSEMLEKMFAEQLKEKKE